MYLSLLFLFLSYTLSFPCYYSNTSITLSSDCKLGYQCSNFIPSDNTTYPIYCIPSLECQLKRLSYQRCEMQGFYEPTLCNAGYYCPSFNETYKCPEKYYCPIGSYQPIACNIGAFCYPDKQVMFAPLIVCLLFDLLLFVSIFTILKRVSPYATKLAEENYFDENIQLPSVVSSGSIAAPSNGRPSVYSLTSPVVRSTAAHSNLSSPALPFRSTTASSTRHRSINLQSVHASKILTSNFGRANSQMGDKIFFEIEFEDLQVKVGENKTILASITGAIRPGKMTAIMGASGSGKTTFLNCMHGKVPRTSGIIRVNGQLDELSRYKKCIGFVPQEDTLMNELSVYENIEHSAYVRLPANWSNEEIDEHISAVIDTLLLNQVSDNIIGGVSKRGVSGGQKKRCNIGVEVASAPIALFLDEPTTGLDSSASLQICSSLKEIAKMGLTVVSVIHQPRSEIFELFDELFLLGVSGFTAFTGPTEEALPYFQALGFEFNINRNFADELMDIISGSTRPSNSARIASIPSDWFSRSGKIDLDVAWRNRYILPIAWKNRYARSMSVAEAAFMALPSTEDASFGNIGVSFWKQIYLCHHRSIIQQFRQFNSFILEISVSFLAGLLIGISASIFNGELYSGMMQDSYVLLSSSPYELLVPQLAFFICISTGVVASTSGSKNFGEERAIYLREVSSGHNPLSYFIGKVLASQYRIFLGALHFSSIFYILASPRGAFHHYLGIIWMLYLCAFGLAEVVSFFVKRRSMNLVAVFAVVIVSTFCGYQPQITQFTANNAGFLIDIFSYSRWACEGIYSIEILPYSNIYQIDTSASIWGYTLDRYLYDLLYMFIMAFVFRIISFLSMISFDRDRQK